MTQRDGLTVETGTGLEQVEVYYLTDKEAVGLNGCYDDNGHGWYYAFGQPGCLFDSDPSGPYTTRKQAYEAARDVAEELPAWSTLKRRGVV